MMKSRKFISAIVACCLFFIGLPAYAVILPFYKSPQNLKIGMSGDQVLFLQIYMADAGLYKRSDITGYFGPKTQRAIKAFQIKNKIEATGTVGPLTKKRIADLLAPAQVPISAVNISENLPAPLLIATSSSVGEVIKIQADNPDTSKYSLRPEPNYDFKSLAKEIQNRVNDERQKYGLSPVYWDDALAQVAENHSIDQARDNLKTTDPSLLCQYPIIRHEGFTTAGYSLQDRFASGNINYHYGGENIAMIPLSKELLYVQDAEAPIIKCPELAKFTPGHGTEEERTALFNSVMKNSLDAVSSLKPVNWVNREWRTDKETADITVNGWMNSPGHRENILTAEFTLGGIGIAAVNDYIIITHDFVGR